MTAPDLRVARGSLSASLGRAEVVALGVRPGSSVGAPTVLSDLDPTIDLTAHLRRASATGRAGEVTEIPLVDHGRSRTLLLVGVGDSTPGELRRAGAAAARRAKGARGLVVDLGQRTATQVEAVAVGAGLAAYAFAVTSTPPDPSSRPVRRIDFTADASDTSDNAAAAAAVQRAAAVIDAVHLARDLTNTEPNRKSPRWLADRAVRAGESAGLAVSVVDADSLARRGFGGLSAVGAGSARPPVLVRLEYRPTSGGRRPPKHVVLVGKGITFDSGGLSLKPAEAMVAMKTDMAGAAAVLAAMTQLPNLGCEHHVTGLLALAENLPSGSAVRPGDVVTMYDGTTVEVLNTDAEGRLVLADALGLATTAASVPDCVVDLATLTGAASIGLGRRHSALYASDEQLGAQLVRAADSAGELVWRMPLVDEYLEALSSPIADLSHIARDRKVSGGSVTAALFLREFTHGVPWAHLDIAGPARADSDVDEISRGGTGYGVRLLLEWLCRPAYRRDS